MGHDCPDIALRVDIDTPPRLLDRVGEGSLDLAVLYQPSQRTGLVRELLIEERLVMVTRDPAGRFEPARYVHVDWGPDFSANLRAAFPDLPTSNVAVSFGPLALGYLLEVGGVGYFRAGTVAPLLQAGELYPVREAPEFSHSACVVYAAGDNAEALVRAREGLRKAAAGLLS